MNHEQIAKCDSTAFLLSFKLVLKTSCHEFSNQPEWVNKKTKRSRTTPTRSVGLRTAMADVGGAERRRRRARRRSDGTSGEDGGRGIDTLTRRRRREQSCGD